MLSIGHTPRLMLILRGAKRGQTSVHNGKLPVTFFVPRGIMNFLRKGSLCLYDSVMLAAAFSMAFFGFLRCGEFTTHGVGFDPSTTLCLRDICFSPDSQSYALHLKSSKTDVSHKGVTVFLCATGNAECPVRLMKSYTDLRLHSGADASDPLFIDMNGSVLSRRSFISTLKMILTKLGIDANAYSGHSLRIGAATSAAKGHVPDHLIKVLGRWSSDCYQRYIKTDIAHLQQAHLNMCLI